ncbi:Crp/Fnr family transcriptional regulator [Aquimarina sp. U1-2]|uniref:Crp/Fnr family transcriptional regulator n=1 Tax=Aquimarina sp. U1-2 TaxID=2823141 RepID=UPI001AED052C|nr:Crp/Fnr family transcriptional regulator [Aquimarina sp. U1-2]MBP2833798.1 Crp/Fnr family transcriptional regulator [Aquimarina sp. U1-2]
MLREFLLQISSFTEDEVQTLLDSGTLKKAKVNETIFLAGNYFSKLWFLNNGIVRAFRIINGEDYTFFFFTKQNFAVDYQSYLTGEKSPLFFESLTDVEYVEFTKESIEKIYQTIPSFEKVGRIMSENAYLSATERLKQFQAELLEVRYEKLMERDPELFQQIPQYHIASYLGVKPQSLSRIRARLAGKKY